LIIELRLLPTIPFNFQKNRCNFIFIKIITKKQTIMKSFYSVFFLFFLVISCATSLQASHITGGSMTYECLGNNQYKVKMTLFRDCNTVSQHIVSPTFDNLSNFTIYNNSSTTPIQTIVAPYTPILGTLPNSSLQNCLLQPNSCFDSTIYEFTVTLPYDSSGYHIAYQRCCRENSIVNLNNPGQTGMTLSVFISNEAQLSCNNSPVFSAPSRMISCVNTPIQFDFGATDSDGDSLVYSLCSPFLGATPSNPIPSMTSAPPFSNVNYKPNFSASQPFTGSVLIDHQTGMITGTVSTTGLYVLSVCVDEYQNGVWLGRITKDIQVLFVNCMPIINANIREDYINQNGEYVINTCDTVVTIINESGQPQFINDYSWKFVFSQTNIFTSTATNPTIHFPGVGTYKGQLTVNPNDSFCTQTAYIVVNVLPNTLTANFSYQYDSTVIGPVNFQSILPPSLFPFNELWDFGDGTTSSTSYPIHQYADSGSYQVQLTIFDSLCSASITQTVDYMPIPILLSDASISIFEKAQIQPNPIQDQVNLILDSQKETIIQIEIYNSIGQKLFSKEKVNVHQGEQKLNIPTSSLRSGHYYLVIKNGEQLQTLPFVKL
jgi:PKD repeat protein